MTNQTFFERAAFFLTFGSAVSVLFSIAVCHTLMALALAALLLSGEKLRLPPLKLPLGLFLLGTILSLAFSADPAAGRPQLRKFFVFLTLLLIYGTFRQLRHIRWLVIAWAGAATLSAGFGLIQFSGKYEQARLLGVPFYQYYVADRITGFMSHWMTFGGQIMITALLLAAFLLFSDTARRQRWLGLFCALVLAAAIVLGFTRSIWLGTGAGGLYLLWFWRRKLILLLPVILAAALWLGPNSLRERFTSLVRPHGELDSNEHRIVTWRTGWEILKAHPWLGIGPELIKEHFNEYVPTDVPRPLPEGWYGHLHNIYLHYAAERGIPTTLALLWLLGKILFDFRRALRRRAPPGVTYILHGAAAVLIGILVEGFFELNLGDTEVLTMFLAVVACGYAALDHIHDGRATQAGA